jgi:2-dehydro-3-deoxygluconokinase
MQLKNPNDCRWDALSLGEVMLRLDPGEGRIHTTRQFQAWEGGGEYNVARGLRRCFGLRTAVVTAFADNPVGRLVEDFILQGGVDTSLIRWVDYDGVGRTVRNGLNFTERGYGPRGAVGCSDRGLTAASQLKAGQIDWENIFGVQKVRWFHTGGIFAALSATTPDVALEACQAAHKHGTVTSYDLNYRDSLWKSIGGQKKAQEVNQAIAPHIDVLFGNEEDFSAALGFDVAGTDHNFDKLETDNFKRMIEQVVKKYPNVKAVATTLRTAKSATVNDWGAICWVEGKFFEVEQRPVELMDRVGGGDSFASGFAYGLLMDKGGQWALECGVAHGALAMSTPGDTSMASLKEVTGLMKGGSARIQR